MTKINSQYSMRLTEDGSPTLVLSTGVDHLLVEEKMHSLFGAAAETDYIYGPSVRWTLEQVNEPTLLVAGLGIGYIEFLIAREATLKGRSVQIFSFESDTFLKENMLSWLYEEGCSLAGVLDRALTSTAGPVADSVKEYLRVLHESGRWRFFGDIAGAKASQKCHGILYDLYSSKIDPYLWSENFLNSFLSRVAGPECSFSTFAAKSSIKRSLKTHNFKMVKKRGFGKKRESTLAFRSSINIQES